MERNRRISLCKRYILPSFGGRPKVMLGALCISTLGTTLSLHEKDQSVSYKPSRKISTLVTTLVGAALVFVVPPLYIYKRRQDSRRAAERIADTAANRLDLDWTYRLSVIQAHDRKGPCPKLVLDAVPSQSEIDGGLPAARVRRT